MSKKRYIAAFGAAGLVFAGVFGAAATLNVDGGAIQTGADDNLTCTSNVNVESYLVDYNQYEAPASSLGVRVGGFSPGCQDQGNRMLAKVLDGDGNRLGINSASEGEINSESVQVNWGEPVDVEEIEEIRVTID